MKGSDCRAKGDHSVSYYVPEVQDEMKYLMDTICAFHAHYENWSPHIFHRELAETLFHHYKRQ